MMFFEESVLFLPDHILKAEMLTSMEKYPKEMFCHLFCEYSDGILIGADLKVKESNLLVMPGLLKWKGLFYRLNESIICPYEANEKQTIVKVRFQEKKMEEERIFWNTEIYLAIDRETNKNEIELGRFILKEGAVLRQEYQDFKDFGTLHNTINLLHVPYAGRTSPTLHPKITAYFGKEILKVKNSTPIDASFGMLCLQNAVIQRTVVEAYIEHYFPEENTETFTLLQLHGALEKILEKADRGGLEQKERVRNRRTLILE